MFSQRIRLIILFIYLSILFAANYFAFGRILPTASGESLWFYGGLASILLGSLLVTPFYTKPVDAISYAVVVGIALYSLNMWAQWGLLEKITFVFAFVYCAWVLLLAFSAIITKDSPKKRIQKFSNTCRIFANFFGNQSAIFSVVILFSVIAFHRHSAKEVLTIVSIWAIIVAIKPENRLFNICETLKKMWATKIVSITIGEIVAYQTPSLVLIRQKERKTIDFGTPLIFKDEHAPLKAGISLDYVGRDEGLLLRAIECDIPKAIESEVQKIAEVTPLNCVSKFTPGSPEDLKSIPIFKQLSDFVGIVAPETSVVSHLYFEVIRENDIEEGRLVEVSIRGKSVLYQVMDGLTKEDIIYKKNTFGYVRAKAKKIGIWDNERNKFIPVKWLPRSNAPVFLKTTTEYIPKLTAVGHFPRTNYTVNIESVSDLVTYNTAILGILGVGKSMLGIELVERMIAEKIKVVCIDLTNQYASELVDFYNGRQVENILKELKEIGAKGKTNYQRNVEEGGSIREFKAKICSDLNDFIRNKPDLFLKIYNPSHFEAWKQDSRMYPDGRASMATLTATEITQIISEATLQIVQGMEMTDKARVCMVYEEAHSLIPEWTSVAAEGDRSASNGTARAILQGRKYGLGCLLITQRTANVTKTILNQCNTIFAMRIFDDTGKGFLANYIGSEHADILSTLQERYAVFFGKASSCEDPVLLKLNDQSVFRSVFRKKYPPKRIEK